MLNSCSSSKDSAFAGEMEQNDYLVYLIDEYPKQRQLIFYDPASNTHTKILPDWDIDEFSLGVNNRLAFSSSHNGNSKIYVLDFPYTENVPAEITLDISTENELLSWSPDGHYLLFDSSQTGTKKLSVWDGKVISDIYNYHEKVADVVWSSNGQLAFTDFYTFVSPHDGDSSEVFIWDGKDIVSVSQNPSGVDRSPTWNKENQLAFLSERNGEYDIFVWNGVSKNNGVPDINTFLNIAPSLTQYFSNPTWTNSGSLAFSGNGTWDLNVQIYEWDGQIARNISKNPLSHNGGQTWRNDGYWSFITFFSESQNLYIRDEINQTVVKTKGQYKPAWSQNGLLMFCVPDPQDWTLSIWNGKNVVEVAHGYFIVAKWNNGEYVFCSNG
jgi:Tol biopolymer transport system component